MALKDPQSSMFRAEAINGTYLCGEVNARNSQGGYVGFVRYISSESGFAIEGGSTDSFFGSSKETQQIIQELDQKIMLMRSLNREPTTEELHKANFQALWIAYCI